MFKKKREEEKETKSKLLKEGWTPDLIEAVTLDSRMISRLGVHCQDFDIPIDGFVIQSLNFEVERRAYGFIRLVPNEHGVVDVPTVLHFFLPGDEQYSRYPDHESTGSIGRERQNRVYGSVVLDGRYLTQYALGKNDILPIFQVCLHLEDKEWSVVQGELEMSDKTTKPMIGIRIGLSEKVTEDLKVKNADEVSLLIHGIWFKQIKVYSAESLRQNKLFQGDVGGF